VSFILALGAMVAGGLAAASPAAAQSGRFRVLVPTLEREGDVKKGFAEDVAKEVRKLIDGMPTHAPVDNGDLKARMKQFGLKEENLNCITSRQLAAQSGWELVMCGSAKPAAGGFEVTASFINAKDQQTYDVPVVTVADAKQAAQHIFQSFESYVRQLSLVVYCNEDLGREDWNSALQKCDEALGLNAKSVSALYGKGYALMKLDRLDESLEALKATLDLNPVHQEALLAAGYVTAKLERKEESREYYRQYLELNPGNAQVRLNVAIEAMQAGDPEGALAIAEQGMQGDEVDLTLTEYAGYFAVAAATSKMEPSKGQNGGTGQLTPEATALFEKGLDYLGRVFAAKGDSVAVNVLVQQLNSLTQLGRTAEAVDFGAKAVAAKPGEAQLWRTYALALKEAGRMDEAIAALDTVLARDPQSTNIRALQGQWLVQSGQLDKASAAFRKAVDAGEIESDMAARMIFSTGYNDKYQKNQHDEALAYFEAASPFATQPQTKGMINFFSGYILYQRGIKVQEPSTAASAKQALPIFQRALELFRQSSGYAETSASAAKSLQDLLGATQQYIDIQEALIKRGR
jgi:tetratricopeptide (TPR) repeat protein